MPAITSTSPLEAGGAVFQRAKTATSSAQRPISIMSEATEIFDTDFEDESDYEGASPKSSFESSDSRRRSQTTISSYDEAPTPSPRTSVNRGHFDLRFRPVEGPKGPHLFRASQVSAELDFDYAMQMSPLVPKEQPVRTATAFTDDTVTPVTHHHHQHTAFSLDTALQRPQHDLHDPEAHIRSWSTQQVIDWMYETGIDTSVIDCFDIHDINGNVLLDLQFEDLKELDIPSFGKRHQLWSAICLLRGEDATISPQPTPFQDISRPCTANTRRSPSRNRVPPASADDDLRPTTPSREKKRRGRKAPKAMDVITPAESVSIVAIEQLMPKPHKCAKGEQCAKWRKQQRELQQVHDEHGIGRFPISPTKGGHIFVAGDPGNAQTAYNMIPNVQRQPVIQQQQQQVEDPYRPMSEAQPSIVASSDLLGPGQLPDFTLHEDSLNQLGSRDPQDNVKQFLNFQHLQSPTADDAPLSPSYEMFPSKSVSPFPAHNPSLTSLQQRQCFTPGPPEKLRSLPRLEIPRSASAGPQLNNIVSPQPANSICRSATASPDANLIYRLGTPASEMDVPVSTTAIPNGPISRDTSQSVPPNMQFRNQQPLSRSHSRAGAVPDWRRPSMQLPAVKEGEVFSTSPDNQSLRPGMATSNSADSIVRRATVRDPAHHSPTVQTFTYGTECTHAGWMKKRKTKMLRHEWQDAHFRLHGTSLAMHANARLSSAAMDTINVDNYAVACSSVASGNKLSAAMKAFSIKTDAKKNTNKPNGTDATAFAFQLVPAAPMHKDDTSLGKKKAVASSAGGKTHHFAVKTKDERIDWMRELMLAKALQQKGKGYEVEVNGVQA